MESSHTNESFFHFPHSCMTFFLSWNTKGEIQQNVHAALFHAVKVNGNQELSTLRNYKKHLFIKFIRFTRLSFVFVLMVGFLFLTQDYQMTIEDLKSRAHNIYGAFFFSLNGKEQREHPAKHNLLCSFGVYNDMIVRK